MKVKRLTICSVSTGVFTILSGIPYMAGLYGPTESEVKSWGQFALLLGIAVLFFSMLINREPPVKLPAAFAVGITVLIQIPPVILWFIFHGYGISDGVPPASFTAHWAYSAPHIIVILLGLLSLQQLYARD